VALFYRSDDGLQFTRGEINRVWSTPVRFRRRGVSSLNRYLIEIAPFPQGRFGRLGLEIVPLIEGLLSLQQIPEPPIGAPLIEYPPDFIEFVRKKFSGEREHQRRAEIEFLLVRDRELFFLVVGIVRPCLDVLLHVGLPKKLAGLPAEDGLMLARLPEAGEFERM
jgi:hypothetical protein